MLLKDFIKALKFVSVAMGKKDTRSYLNGVYLEFGRGIITLTATDGRRLHTVEMAHDHDQPDGGYILEGNTIQLWGTLTDSAKVQLNLIAPLGRPCNTGMPAMLCEGKFPDYSRVIPTGDPRPAETIHFDCAYLSASTRALKGLGGDICQIALFGPESCIRITPDFTGFWQKAIIVVMPVCGR